MSGRIGLFGAVMLLGLIASLPVSASETARYRPLVEGILEAWSRLIQEAGDLLRRR